MDSKLKILITVSLLLLVFVFCVNSATAQAQDLNDGLIDVGCDHPSAIE